MNARTAYGNRRRRASPDGFVAGDQWSAARKGREPCEELVQFGHKIFTQPRYLFLVAFAVVLDVSHRSRADDDAHD